MKKVFYIITLFMALLSTEMVLALEDINLNIDMPKEVKVGENFTIGVNVNTDRNISGFEYRIETPMHGAKYIKFINATENREIKEKAGEFYILNLKENSVFVSFALFDRPFNSDFHLITIKGKALNKGNLSIRFIAVASDEDGRAIKLPPITYNLKVVGSDKDNNEKTDGEETGSNIFSRIVGAILNFLRMIFGG
ncbi:cellulosome anchoring protein cohesin region [Methanothermococcus sp. SCGC AD-155-M21]|nr:cellulosome anchoring protein cohesin region [Methanothermococcus sp. SCGC AD-155-M21]